MRRLNRRPAKRKHGSQKRKPKPTADTKLEHCRDMLATWSSKVKRAQTGMKKWQQKVRYYERQLAVAAKRSEPKQEDNK